MTMGGYKGGHRAVSSKIAQIEVGRRKHDRRHRISMRAAAQEDATLIPASEFVVPAQDAQGHSARMGCRVPPLYQRLAHIYVKSGKFPWETESDLMRWAVWKGLERIAEWIEDSKVSNLRAQINGMLIVIRDEEASATFGAVIDRAERAVANLIASGAQSTARRMVREILANIEEMDDSHWRERYKKEMERRFAPLLGNSVPGTPGARDQDPEE